MDAGPSRRWLLMILVPLTLGVGVVLTLLILRWQSLVGSPYFLLEIPSGANLPSKMVLALREGKLRLMYEATLVAEDGTKSVRILSDDLEITSDQGGVVTCAVPDLPPVVLDRTTRTFKGPQVDGEKPITILTQEQAAVHLHIPWILSKRRFKALVKQGDRIEPYLVGVSAGINDHYGISLWDGTRLDVYAPEGVIRSAYVEPDDDERDGRIEWVIAGEQ
jgi:hypothetical protein